MTRVACRTVIAAYFVVFWIALPVSLGWMATMMDRALDLSTEAHSWGRLVAAAGFTFAVWGILSLWRHGKGLPISALPPRHLTERGAYAIVRHPIYVGFNVAILGVAIAAGSWSGRWIVAPLFAAAWIVYALLEERTLGRRFGEAWLFYRCRVGLFGPYVKLYGLCRFAIDHGALSIAVEGSQNIPASGGVVLMANHTNYLDPVFAAYGCSRNVVFVSTSFVFRNPIARILLVRFHIIPLHRHRQDIGAYRQIIRALERGFPVVFFPEGERSTVGKLQMPLVGASRLLSGVRYPVVPIGISGGYAVGPRWAGVLRRQPVRLRIDSPIVWNGPPAAQIYNTLRSLIDDDPQQVGDSIGRADLRLVLWRCPRCGDEPEWDAPELACGRCGLRQGGGSISIADLARPIWTAQEEPAVSAEAIIRRVFVKAHGERVENSRPGRVIASPQGLHVNGVTLELSAIESITIEGRRCLRVSTRDLTWEVDVTKGSAFRLQLALERLCAAHGTRRSDPLVSRIWPEVV